MGLFSFIKGAGKKVFGKKETIPTEEEAKITALTKAVTQLGIPIDDLIFEANKPMLKDPDEIYPGQILRIPAL